MNFPTTHWTMLALATLNGDSSANEALGEFYQRYRKPVIAFIQRRGVGPYEAEDLAHDFTVHLLKKSMLRRADATRGKFRSFLIGALVRFLNDERAKRMRLKRGGGAVHVTLDGEPFREAECAASPDDTAAFDYEWALELLSRALQTAESHYADRGRAEEFSVLRAYLPGGVQPPAYQDSARRLSMTLAAFKTEVHRLRVRFRGLLLHEVAATVTSPEEIKSEVRYLRQVLQNAAEMKPSRESA